MTDPSRKKPPKAGAENASPTTSRLHAPERTRDLSRQLLTRLGKGYSPRNLWYVRDFYMTYRDRTPKVRAKGPRTSLVHTSKPADAVKILREAGAELAEGFSRPLSWTHHRALLAVSDPAARADRELSEVTDNAVKGWRHSGPRAKPLAVRSHCSVREA